MKVLLVGINSRYTHTNLAIRCLKYYSNCKDVHVLESNINADMRETLESILSYNSDIVGFSCYIFNIEYVKRLISDIRKISPTTKILVGGPEPCDGDITICGEGEVAFKNLVTGSNEQGYINLDSLYGMYTKEYLSEIDMRTVYYEASRGCPFSCSYCMSGLSEKLRYKSLEIIKKELKFLSDNGVSQIKFVDRTFNANKRFCIDILEYILEENLSPRLHFEVAADLFDSQMLDIISRFPVGQLELEIGIQSFNSQTLCAINRKSDMKKVMQNIETLLKFDNCHIHVDLIAGLPMENYQSFKNSFNMCYSLGGHYIQVGFLKMLNGSKLHKDAHMLGYAYSDYPPYEVLSSPDMSFSELTTLKFLENAVSKYYNCVGFINTLKYLSSKYDTPFDFYMQLGKFIASHGNMSRLKKYELLLQFGGDEVLDILRFDYLLVEDTQNLIKPLFMAYSVAVKSINRDKTKCAVELNIGGEQKMIVFDRAKKHAISGQFEYHIEN